MFLFKYEYIRVTSTYGHCCKNDKSDFCYICDEYVTRKKRRAINNHIKNFSIQPILKWIRRIGQCDIVILYKLCFKAKHVDQHWLMTILFGIHMIRWEPHNHIENCYFKWYFSLALKLEIYIITIFGQFLVQYNIPIQFHWLRNLISCMKAKIVILKTPKMQAGLWTKIHNIGLHSFQGLTRYNNIWF